MENKELELSEVGMKFSIVKEYFLYRLYYGKKQQLALHEFHEFCDHVNNYFLEYKDILIYRKCYSMVMLDKSLSLTNRFKNFCDLVRKEV